MADESTRPTSTFDPTNASLPGGFYDYQSLGVAQRVVLFTIILMISITGIIGNSIVIVAIVLSRKLRSTFNWFILNLACADLLTSICIPFHVAYLHSTKYWTYFCVLLFMCACVAVSLTTHAFLGFTSWYRVTRNHDKFKKMYKARNLCLMIAFTWVFNFSSVCVIARLVEEKTVFAIVFWAFGHFAIIVTGVPKTMVVHRTPSREDEANEGKRRKDTE